MSQLSNAEKRLWARVSERNRASLMQIRSAVEKVWAPDAPRLVTNFTDHGFEHCQRLVRYVQQLLDASTGQPLNEVETYILLAAIYLHDVGMQCDVPEVQREAGVEIKATEASGYSKEEQTAIRSNHHLLTVAWLSHAYRTGETILASPIQTVPAQLMKHLMDVCKYHTKLSLQECDASFNYKGRHRKRLLAALLRFADEMDIIHSRVNIETVEAFRLPPENAVYWWLHYFTDLSLERSVLTFHVTLHDEDVERYGEVVREQVAERFRRKNDPVLDVLADYGVGVRIRYEVSLDSSPFMKRPQPEIWRELTGESVPLAEKLSALGHRRRDAPAVCLGAVYMDLELRPVDIDELSARRQEEWTNVKSSLRIGGSAWYVYHYLDKLKCKTRLATKIGDESEEFFAEHHIEDLRKALTRSVLKPSQTGKGVNKNHTAMTVHLIQCRGNRPIATTMLTDTGVLESLRWDDDEIWKRVGTLDHGGLLYLSGYFKTALHWDLQQKLKDLGRRKVIVCLDHGRFKPKIVGPKRIDSLRESLKYVDVYFCTTREMIALFGRELHGRPEDAPEEVLDYLDKQPGLELPEVILVRDNKRQKEERLMVTAKSDQKRVYASIPVHRVQAEPNRFVGVGNAFHARFIDCMLNHTRWENLTSAVIEWALRAQRMVEWIMNCKDEDPTTFDQKLAEFVQKCNDCQKCDDCENCAQRTNVALKKQKGNRIQLPSFNCLTTLGGKNANI